MYYSTGNKKYIYLNINSKLVLNCLPLFIFWNKTEFGFKLIVCHYSFNEIKQKDKNFADHSDGASRLSNRRTDPSPQPAISRDRPKESEARLVTQLSAPVGMSYR